MVSKNDILRIAKEIVENKPGTTPHRALREAKDIASHRSRFLVKAEEKSVRNERTPWEELPEETRATIKRQRKAADDRKKHGRELPVAVMISGGKVSPK